ISLFWAGGRLYHQDALQIRRRVVLLHYQNFLKSNTNQILLMSTSIHCPFCNQEIIQDQPVVGEEVECSNCHNTFRMTAEVLDAASNSTSSPNQEHPNLINCPDCGKLISKFAKNCPGCGHPFEENNDAQQSAAISSPPKVQTIEKTSKEWKAGQLLGAFIAICGAISGVNSFTNGEMPIGGIILFFIGFFIVLISRALAWWNNG
ncbi:MAG: hypothetical protein IKS83_04540, partial [Victivallales bacterium]|nr:hypothetical protein [Victivallales bacterium]